MMRGREKEKGVEGRRREEQKRVNTSSLNKILVSSPSFSSVAGYGQI